MTDPSHRPFDYMRSVGHTDVVLFDLDSTLADTRHRHHHTPLRDPAISWTDYSMLCADDTPIAGTVRLAQLLHAGGYRIHILSARAVEATDLTVTWLRRHRVPFDALHLRHADEPVDSVDYKLGRLHRLRTAGLTPRLVVEDWPPLVTAIDAIGIPVLCVNPCYVELDQRTLEEIQV